MDSRKCTTWRVFRNCTDGQHGFILELCRHSHHLSGTYRSMSPLYILKFQLTLRKQSITQVLYDLSVHQELHTPLREEIRSVLAEDGGWTKQGLTKMKKLDSVLRESQRLHGVTSGIEIPLFSSSQFTALILRCLSF